MGNILAIILFLCPFLLIWVFLQWRTSQKKLKILEQKILEEQKKNERYSGIQNLEAEKSRFETELETLVSNVNQLKTQRAKLQSQVNEFEIDFEAREFGLYEPKYNFQDSEGHKIELERIRAEQKILIKETRAVNCPASWSVDGSLAKGKKMVREQVQLMLRAFNGECESLILKVKYNNINKVEEQIQKLSEQVNKLGGSMQCYITKDFLNLKIRELYLVHEYQEKRWQEEEEQRQIREQMREEERARRDFERAQQEAEREAQKYEVALEKARRDVEQATGEKHARLAGEIERLSQLLAEAEARRERAISQAQLTRSGYVYVISNIGSFGEDVYKIGMTRRLDPMDRVRELGDASVPFTFDVHAMIYSDDAPTLENTMHRVFDERRLNRVNAKKEFFRVTLEEIRNIAVQHRADIHFTLVAEAIEYRKTQAMLHTEKPMQA